MRHIISVLLENEAGALSRVVGLFSQRAYNLTSYINRINNEPQTLGNLFRDLECQLETLAISMEIFLKILEQLIQSAQIVKRNKDLEQIIHMLRVYTKKQLGFMCES
jgi:acetolactate synthase small subunit